jgi:hypothetical protein
MSWLFHSYAGDRTQDNPAATGPSVRMLPTPRLVPHCQHLEYNEKYIYVKSTVPVGKCVWTNYNLKTRVTDFFVLFIILMLISSVCSLMNCCSPIITDTLKWKIQNILQ